MIASAAAFPARPVPGYVEEELRGYLQCGLLCFGFGRAPRAARDRHPQPLTGVGRVPSVTFHVIGPPAMLVNFGGWGSVPSPKSTIAFGGGSTGSGAWSG